MAEYRSSRSLRTELAGKLKRLGLLSVFTEAKMFERLFKISNKRLLRRHTGRSGLKLHLGCGSRLLEGWVNVDLIWRPGIVVLRLPQGLRSFPDNSVEYIYACHLLEHFEYPREVRCFLKGCLDVLRPGGVMRVGVPDIEVIIKAYARQDREFFKRQSRLHPDWCTTKLEHLMYAVQQDGEHRYGYDFDTLQKAFLASGFSKVITRNFGETEFESLRVDYRTDGEVDDHLTLFVDAIKAPSLKAQESEK